MPLNQATKLMIVSQKASINSLRGNKEVYSRTTRRRPRKLEDTFRFVATICSSWLIILRTIKNNRLIVTSAAPKKTTAHKSTQASHIGEMPDENTAPETGSFPASSCLGSPVASSRGRAGPMRAIPRDKLPQALFQWRGWPIAQEAAGLRDVRPGQRYIAGLRWISLKNGLLADYALK